MVNNDSSIICLVNTICSIIVMVDNGCNSGQSVMLLVTVVYSFKKFKNLLGGVLYICKNKTVKNHKYMFALFSVI